MMHPYQSLSTLNWVSVKMHIPVPLMKMVTRDYIMCLGKSPEVLNVQTLQFNTYFWNINENKVCVKMTCRYMYVVESNK